MPRACTVCTHAERDVIDRALVESTPKRRIAAQHGLVESAVRRHAEKHLPGVLVLAAEAGEVMRADGLMAEAQRLHGEALAALEAAKAAGSLGATLQALDRTQRSVALISTLFDRLPEIHDRELVMRWEDPEASPCKKCGYEEP